MFDFLKNAQRVSDLTTQNALLKGEVDKLKVQLEHLKTKEDTTQADFSFDFSKVDAFSIERNGDKHIPVTIIGYFMEVNGVKELREWYLYCSVTTHAKLVKEFEKQKGSNGTK